MKIINPNKPNTELNYILNDNKNHKSKALNYFILFTDFENQETIKKPQTYEEAIDSNEKEQ